MRVKEGKSALNSDLPDNEHIDLYIVLMTDTEKGPGTCPSVNIIGRFGFQLSAPASKSPAAFCFIQGKAASILRILCEKLVFSVVFFFFGPDF